jgi:uncharacterized protein YbjT (DUF2867 family)
VVAVVRSKSACKKISGLNCETHIVDYSDSGGLSAAASDCDCAVHLVGIIKKTGNNTYEQAHELSCAALVKATHLAGLKQIVALSIIGSDITSRNACLASRGRSENILLDGDVPATIIRVPMVLGEDDFASRSLTKKAKAGICFTFRASSLEQPIYAGDLVNAITAVIQRPPGNEVIELAGMESVTRRELIARAGSTLGNHPTVISIPLFAGLFIGKVLEILLPSPPVTADMIEILDHDDQVDAEPVARQLGIELTSLDQTLAKVI